MWKSIDPIKPPLGRIALVFCLTSGTAAHALGFGEIRLDSALGQRLEARIPVISVSPDERRSLSVRMAGPAAFERFGIERVAVIDAIELTIEDAGAPGGRIALHLTSEQPIQAPFLNFLIVAETSGGRMLREYTVLLDPPGWTSRTAPVAATPRTQVVQPAPVVSAAPPATPERKSVSPAVVVLPEGGSEPGGRAADTAPPVADGPDRYGPVGPGETLWGIASRTRFPDVSTYQMLLAIYRANPSAFDGSINVLLQGSILDIPSPARVRAVDADAARRIVAAAQRQAVRTQPVVSPTEPTQASAAPPVPDAPEPPPTVSQSEPQSLPEPVPEDETPAATGGQLRLRVPREFPVIHPVGNAAPPDAATMAASGAVIGPEFGTLSPAPVNVPTATGSDHTVGNFPVTGGIETGQTAVALTVAMDTAARPPGEPSANTKGSAQNPAAGESTTADAPASDVAGGEGGAAAGDWIAPGSTRDVAARPTGLFSPSNILLLLAALGLLIALLLWQRRRQYKPLPADFSAGFAATGNGDADAAVGAPDMDDQPEESGDAPAVPGVSPDVQLQDAENQIAIGLHDQARATIEDGLSRHPGHAGLQDKLLELDYVTGDADRFRADVDRFRTVLARNGVRWAGISAMGRILVPDDPRFAFGKTGAETSADSAPADTPDPAPAAPPAQPVAQAQPAADPLPAGRPLDQDESAQPAEAPEAPAFDADAAPAPEDAAPEAGESEAGELDPEADETEAEASSSGLELDIENTNLNNWPGAPAEDAYSMPHNGQPGPLAGADESFEPDVAPIRPVSGNDDRRLNDRAGDDATSFDIDLSEFDLDEDTSTETPADEDVADPVETRLDVARMYIEMNDPGSARGLLYEVVEDGDAGQRGAAQALLDQL